MSSSSPPIFMEAKPEPKLIQRYYHNRKLSVWSGKVRVSKIHGWIENPRIKLAKRKIMDAVGHRELNQDEIFDLMKKDPDVKLKDLRSDIVKNGLREPLTLSYSGKLLDGNRRFFALKYALEDHLNPNRQDLEIVDAYVLMDDATDDDERNVLVEENFSASLKIEWPDYVKASMVVEAKESGLDEDQIADKFDWKKAKVKEALAINEIIEEFRIFATTDIDPNDESGGGLGLPDHEAEEIAAKNYQYFNEAKKSFHQPIKTDIDFKTQFFKWIHQDKFSSFPEVRIAYKAWNNPEAKSILMSSEPDAAKSAKAVIDYKEKVGNSGAQKAGRVDSFIKFLNELSSIEIQAIPAETRQMLEEAISRVIKMNKSVSE